MKFFVRFQLLVLSLLFSNSLFAIEAHVVDVYMNGCATKGSWVDPYQVNTCFESSDYTCRFEADGDRFRTSCLTPWGSRSYVIYYDSVRCPANSEYDPSTLQCKSVCEYGSNPDGTCMDACQFKESIGGELTLYWHPAVYGELVTGACYGDFGATRCELKKSASTVLCTGVPDGNYLPDSQCSTDFTYTGNQCDGNNLFWGANGPDEPIFPPDEPEDPTHEPDDPTGDIEDPSVLPDDSSNSIVPPDVDDKPDVENPDTDESTDTAVLSAIKGLNEDINTSLHSLNVDLNETQATIGNAVLDVKSSVVDNTQAIQEQQINDNKIYENTKALIQQANADITTAVNNNTNATIGVRNDLKGLGTSVDGLGDGLNGLGDTLDGIKGLLDGGEFGTPTGTELSDSIFGNDDIESIKGVIAEQREYISGLGERARSLVNIETDFKKGKLNKKTFTIDDVEVESGLQRFDEVSSQVRPVVLFICALTGLWILFGAGSRK